MTMMIDDDDDNNNNKNLILNLPSSCVSIPGESGCTVTNVSRD